MSIKLIQHYYNEKYRIRHLTITKQDSENILHCAFARVLEGFASKQNLAIYEEVRHRTEQKNIIRFDGVLKNELGLDFGYWEAKANVNLEDER